MQVESGMVLCYASIRWISLPAIKDGMQRQRIQRESKNKGYGLIRSQHFRGISGTTIPEIDSSVSICGPKNRRKLIASGMRQILRSPRNIPVYNGMCYKNPYKYTVKYRSSRIFMVPQAQKHNGGAWAKSVEAATRKYASRATGDVYVITGPAYSPNIKESEGIGAGQVRVPMYLFKLVYDQDTNRAWAHWHLNDDATRGSRPISYGELVKRTGINFLPGLMPLE
jgi:hypothetical protein